MYNCPRCGKTEIDTCPICGEPVAVYSRMVGYMRPIHMWNDGKKQEFEDRTEYTKWGADPIWYENYKENYKGDKT